MPNGRSGGFYLKPLEFHRLLEQHDGETVVGRTLEDPLTASQMLRILARWKRDVIPIEEQDHSWYIIHFPRWVTVDERSPLFSGFRQAHAAFLRKWAEEHAKDD